MHSSKDVPASAGTSFFYPYDNPITECIVGATLLILLFLLFRIYAFAFSFGSSFDDAWNLSGLAQVHDLRSALEFIVGGAAGPTGRPLALLSFVVHAGSWPSAPQDFLYENTLLHLLNVLLLFWLVYRLALHLPWRVVSPAWMALFAALWWGASPLLFSASIMTIQRMTSLSALFCLAGVLLYVIGWQRLGSRPRSGLFLMAFGVGVGTLLAGLSKENGLLLPGLVLVLDRVLFARSNALVAGGLSEPINRAYKWLRIVLLWLPTLAVLGYLALQLSGIQSAYVTRPFSLTERLLTEPRILLDYLKLLLFPVRSELGPFNDDYPLSHGLLQPVSTLVAIVLLLVSVGVAWRVRKSRWCLFSFAAGWFLWGHLTESSFIPLELYFEHRNYLPAVGVALALAALLFHPQVSNIARTAVVVLLLGSSIFVLRETALLWGDRPVAAASWYARHPQSLRALQFNLNVLHERQDFDQYVEVVNNVHGKLREGTEYAMIRLAEACNFQTPEVIGEAATIAMQKLREPYYNHSVTDTLDRLADLQESRGCKGLGREHIDTMLSAIIENPSPGVRSDMRAQAHEIRARLTLADRDLDATMHHLEEAFRLRPTLSVGITMAGVLTSAQLYDAAEQKLDETAAAETKRPFLRQRWRQTVAEMREIIERERRDDALSHTVHPPVRTRAPDGLAWQ